MSIVGGLSGSILLGCDEPSCGATAYAGEEAAGWVTTRTKKGTRWDWCPAHPPWGIPRTEIR